MILRVRDADRFDKIASGIQAILISAAVVIGGAWTLYTFNSQLQVENAQAQVQKLKRELELEAKVELSMDLRQLEEPKPGRKIVAGIISIKNVGNTTTTLNLEDTPIKIFRVEFSESGSERWELIRKLSLRSADKGITVALIAHVGAANTDAFATVVDAPGLYAVQFAAARRPEEVTQALSSGAQVPGGRIVWEVHRYIVVK